MKEKLRMQYSRYSIYKGNWLFPLTFFFQQENLYFKQNLTQRPNRQNRKPQHCSVKCRGERLLQALTQY